MISGHLDGNETVTECMAREAKEESGIRINPVDLKVVHTMHRLSKGVTEDREYIDFFLSTDKWVGEPKVMEPDKSDEIAWYPLENLPKNILPYIKKAIEDYQKSITFSES